MSRFCFFAKFSCSYFLIRFFFSGLFLIDPNGEIRHTLVNDFPVGRSVDEALRILKAFQFVEKHGEGMFSKFLSIHEEY